MTKNRLEAFSDGVIAIIITIMVLEIKVPRGEEIADIQPLLPVFLSYLISFVYVGIYWNNHHHLLHSIKNVTAGILWTNLHLLFWLSLFPYATAWAGNHHRAVVPVVGYGIVLLMAGVAYYFLQKAIIRSQGAGSLVKKAIGKDLKGYSSLAIYALAIGLAKVDPWISIACYVGIACVWLVPDKRIQRVLEEAERAETNK
jgi:uncharacterized membrane protein